jgi:hypothetical protein
MAKRAKRGADAQTRAEWQKLWPDMKPTLQKIATDGHGAALAGAGKAENKTEYVGSGPPCDVPIKPI